jgi:threonine aldolase
MGGGMRQAGILAAAGIIALESHVSRLPEDHARAKRIARELAKIPGIVITPKDTDINIVFFTWPPAEKEEFFTATMGIFRKHGIIINPPDNCVFRFVTHHEIGDNEVETILAAANEAFVEVQFS